MPEETIEEILARGKKQGLLSSSKPAETGGAGASVDEILARGRASGILGSPAPAGSPSPASGPAQESDAPVELRHRILSWLGAGEPQSLANTQAEANRIIERDPNLKAVSQASDALRSFGAGAGAGGMAGELVGSALGAGGGWLARLGKAALANEAGNVVGGAAGGAAVRENPLSGAGSGVSDAMTSPLAHGFAFGAPLLAAGGSATSALLNRVPWIGRYRDAVSRGAYEPGKPAIAHHGEPDPLGGVIDDATDAIAKRHQAIKDDLSSGFAKAKTQFGDEPVGISSSDLVDHIENARAANQVGKADKFPNVDKAVDEVYLALGGKPALFDPQGNMVRAGQLPEGITNKQFAAAMEMLSNKGNKVVIDPTPEQQAYRALRKSLVGEVDAEGADDVGRVFSENYRERVNLPYSQGASASTNRARELFGRPQNIIENTNPFNERVRLLEEQRLRSLSPEEISRLASGETLPEPPELVKARELQSRVPLVPDARNALSQNLRRYGDRGTASALEANLALRNAANLDRSVPAFPDQPAVSSELAQTAPISNTLQTVMDAKARDLTRFRLFSHDPAVPELNTIPAQVAHRVKANLLLPVGARVAAPIAEGLAASGSTPFIQALMAAARLDEEDRAKAMLTDRVTR